MSVPASALPSVMQARKAKLAETAVVLPAMGTVREPLKPVVNSVKKKEEDKKEEKKEELDLSEFIVGSEDAEPEKVEDSKEVVPSTQVIETKEGEDGDKPDYRWMYKSLEGNHQLVVKENRELRDKFVELETKFNLLTEKKVVDTKPDLSLELTQEESEQYSESLPVLNKLLLKQQRNIEQNIIKPLQNEIAELKTSTSSVAERSNASDEGNFVQQVRMQVKNIGSDFDAILKSPKWADFTKRTLGEYTDITIGQALWDAHKKRDLGKVVKVFEDFAKSGATINAGDAFRAPSVSAATGALPDSTGKKPILKLSKRKEASDKFRKRQISMDEYEKIKALYHEAENEGRIDYSK